MQDKYQRIDQFKISHSKKPRRSSVKKSRPNTDNFTRLEDSSSPSSYSKSPLTSLLWEAISPPFKESYISEAQKLRNHISMMMCVHFAFVMIEMIIYSTQLTLIICELVYIYLVYFGFMTLSSVALMTYISLMFIAPVSGILFVLRIGDNICVVLYLM